MKLKEYFQKHKISQRDFSRTLGISEAHLCNILKIHRSPSLSLAKRIQDITKGQVSLDDLFNPDAPSRFKVKTNEKDKSIRG